MTNPELDFVEEVEDEIIDIELPMDDGSPVLRDYQIKAIKATEDGWKTFSRQLLVLSGGSGKTLLAAHLIKREITKGGRCLFIAHTEELLDQARQKMMWACGIEAELEKADEHASLSAMVVVASLQTLSRDSRLLGFPDDHFALVIGDESHRALSTSYIKILNYFHFGECSLDESWVPPVTGVPYKCKGRVLGLTATPARGDRKNLGTFFDAVPFEFGLLDACREGYLCRPIVKNIPLQIDLKKHDDSEKVMRGNDYNPEFIKHRITPILAEIAKKIRENASHLKTICFLPSIRTSQLLAEALCKEGMNATFVSGSCEDRAEKMQAFRDAGPGSVLSNALIATEGVDIPDVDCVCQLRPTKIWNFYVQCAVRATRTLPGTIDGLKTKEERLAAIAASKKPFFTLLDFLWLSDRIDLIQPVDLVATRPDLRKKMASTPLAPGGTLDLVNLELEASRDLLKSLEAAARKHANKAARTIDPLVWAVSLGDEALATWEPQTAWDELPATASQLDFIRKQHIDVSNVKYRGHANKIIVRLLDRLKLRLASPLQLNFLRQLGVSEDKAMTMTMKEASDTCDHILAEKKARKESQNEQLRINS